MKRFLITFATLMIVVANFAQTTISTKLVSGKDVLEASNYVFEGIPLSGTCHFDPTDSSKIYTTYLIKVTRVFKGDGNIHLGTINMNWDGGYLPRFIRMPDGTVKNLVGNGKGPYWKNIVRSSKKTIFFCTNQAKIKADENEYATDNHIRIQPTFQDTSINVLMDELVDGKSHVAIGIPDGLFKNDEALSNYLKNNKIEVPRASLAAVSSKRKRRDVASNTR